MKKLVFLLVALCLSAIMQAAVTKSVNCTAAGTLTSYFSAGERTTVTDLTVTGTIDARDFKFMRDTLTALAKVDLTAVTIAGYYGSGGTFSTEDRDYSVDAIPVRSFYQKATITSIILPNSITAIYQDAFSGCLGLTKMIIPASVTEIHTDLFYGSTNMTAIQFNNPTPVNLSAYTSGDGSNVIGLYTTNCTIYVPVGSLGNYGAPVSLGGWNLDAYPNLYCIQGTIPTSIQQSSISKLNINVQGLTAILTGLSIGDNLDVYTVHGYSILNKIIDNETIAVNLPMHGVYVVKVGNQVVKVIL